MGKILSGYLVPHPPIIIKEIGKGEERKISETIEAMERVAEDIRQKRPDTIIVITPHGPVFRDAIAVSYESLLKGNLERFNAGDVYISKNNNRGLVEKIVKRAALRDIVIVRVDDATAKEYELEEGLDHGVIVPLYFVEQKYRAYELIHITYGLLSSEDLYSFGKVIQEVALQQDSNVSIIASGDLSHRLSKDGPYGYHPSGPVFDDRLLELIRDKDYGSIIRFDRKLSEAAGECGLRSLDILLGSLDGLNTSPEILSYQKTFGVGYGVVIFHIEEAPGNENESLVDWLYEKRNESLMELRAKEDPYAGLARESLENHILGKGPVVYSARHPVEMVQRKAGVFVSLKIDGHLRGCIGTIAPTKDTIFDEIIDNALKAGLEDPRFLPVNKEELPEIEYSVDVLGQPERIQSKNDLDPREYGVIVEKGTRRGLLLPDLEGVDDVEEQIRIALQKANISQDEDYKISRFRVERHH